MSFGEQLVLDAFHDQAPDDWIVMHSLWLKEHQSKQHAEIDFLVVTHRAALILEVKGGEVFRDEDGMWHIRKENSSDKRVEKDGPFNQARTAWYAVRTYLDEAGWLSLFHDRIWGYGVILPRCMLRLAHPDPAIKPEMLLDMRAFPNGLLQFVEKLTDYWEEDNLRMKDKLHIPRERLKRGLSPDDRKRIRDLLRPLLRPVQGIAVTAREAELQLMELTEEQYKALEFHDPDQPLIIQGAAGTGKTMLAMQQIHRQSLHHKRILFVCYNQLLATYVRKELGPDTLHRGVDVFNYHQLLTTLNKQAGVSAETIEDWTQFNREVADRILYALHTLQMRRETFELYDYLVIDEAQDLMTQEFLSGLELLVHGGWRRGSWTICIDPRQTIFHSHYDEKQFEQLKAIASICPLNLNCRNTREVAAYAHGLSGVEGVPVRKVKGPDPELVWYHDHQQYVKRLRNTVNALIDLLSDLAVSSRDIVILAVSRNAMPEELFTPGFFKRRVVDIDLGPDRDVVQCGTVQAFKGLEAMAVVLVGLKDLDALSSRQLLYVGGSRAKSFLHILLPEQSQGTVQKRLPNVLALLGT